MSESALRRFTLHVDFLAADEREALDQAEAYVEALNLLRLEVDGYTARVSRDGNWSASAPVYCGAPGPDPTDVCTQRATHPYLHTGPGVTGKWGDDDLPRAPDTIETMTGRFTYFNQGPFRAPDSEDTAGGSSADDPPGGPAADDPPGGSGSRPSEPGDGQPRQDPPSADA